MEKETIYITETFRITESMKKRISDFSKKIGENKSELIRSAVNFMIAYFNNQDDFETQKEHILKLLMDYEINRLTTFKRGEHISDIIAIREASNELARSENTKKLLDKISDEVGEELKEKFSYLLEI
ncbi:hypothetical protein ES705_17455 [subsurface metagenome]